MLRAESSRKVGLSRSRKPARVPRPRRHLILSELFEVFGEHAGMTGLAEKVGKMVLHSGGREAQSKGEGRGAISTIAA